MQFKRFFLFLFTFLIVSCTNYNPKLAAPASAIQKATDSTVAFIARSEPNKADPDDKGQAYPYCTGFWISDTTMLTALHCARYAAKVELMAAMTPQERKIAKIFLEVQDPTDAVMLFSVAGEVTAGFDKEPTGIHKSKVVAIDVKHDLAMTQIVDGKMSYPRHSYMNLASETPAVGSAVFTVGQVGGMYFTFTPGYVAAPLRKSTGAEDELEIYGPFLQIVGPIWHGNSGGAIVDGNGDVVGVVSFIMEAPNQGFAIALPSIKNFVEEAQKPKPTKKK